MSRVKLWSYITAAVVVVALLTWGAVRTFGGNSHDPTPTPSTSSGTSSSTTSTGPSSDGCVQVAQAQGQPLTSAPQTEWYVADTGQAMPKTAGGPFLMEDGLGLCYTPDTLGALTAAANILPRTLSPAWEKTVRRQHVPAPTEAQIGEQRGIIASLGLTKPYVQVVNFGSTTSVSNNEVTVVITVAGTLKGEQVSLTSAVRMRWTGTDWVHVEDRRTTSGTLIEWRP